MFGFGSFNSRIRFVRCSEEETDKSSQTSLTILDPKNNFNIFEIIPRNFTITTKNGSCNFNTKMLEMSSQSIFIHLHDNNNHDNNNQDNLQYNLDIADETNVLKKFEQMYQGKPVTFAKDDIPVCDLIAKKLELNFPSFDRSFGHSLFRNEPQSSSDESEDFKVQLSINNIIDNFFVFYDLLPPTFTIKTHKKEYKCNPFGVRVSKVIDQFLNENPDSDVYEYDIEDEIGDFQSICDYFNCRLVPLKMSSIDAIKEIAEDLQILPITEAAESFLSEYDSLTQNLDAQQESVDQINELFDWLSNINENTVTTVKNSIVGSFWSKTEENVQELAAFLLQVIESNIGLHHHLADLLVQLDRESSKSNKLDILVPFIVKKLMKSFGKNFQNCSIIYNLCKRGAISRDELNKQLRLRTNIRFITSSSILNAASNECKALGKVTNVYVDGKILQWFLPEIIELHDIKKASILADSRNAGVPSFNMSNNSDSFLDRLVRDSNQNCDSSALQIVNTYFDKIDKYKQMRDSGEPDNELALALRHDDVDKLQSITSTIHSNFEEQKVPYNIFEDFIPNGQTKYLNYAAAYGSTRCFKYILLNYDKVDNDTFTCAVYGGNIEIIKIVEQKLKEQNNNNKNENNNNNANNFGNMNIPRHMAEEIARRQGSGNNQRISLNPILLSIIKHHNDLFDYIFEDYLSKNKMDNKDLQNILQASAENGNAHSINVLFDKCFEFFIRLSNNDLSLVQNAFEAISRNGFYRLAQFLLKIFKEKDIICFHTNEMITCNGNFSLRQISPFEFENLSILKLFVRQMNQNDLENVLNSAISEDNIHVIKYFFNHLLKEKTFKINVRNFSQFVLNSVCKESSNLFDYLLEQIKLEDPSILEKFVWTDNILETSCRSSNVKASKRITDFILNHSKDENNDKYLDFNFTNSFAAAASSRTTELCQFFIDRKVYIDFDELSMQKDDLGHINDEIFSLIIDNSKPEIREKFYDNLFIPAILNHNKILVELILKESPDKQAGLIEAVNSRDVEIVKLIVKYVNNPSFINKTTREGTALICAVKNEDIDIIKVLLSVPEIDPSLYDFNKSTPLIISARNLNFEIFNSLLDFYGDNIQYQLWQIAKAVQCISNQNNGINWKSNPTICKFYNRILDIKWIDSSIFDSDNNSIIMDACEANDADLIKKLLKLNKIDVNLYNSNTGDTPLLVAVRNENYDISKLLINYPKTNINAKNYNNQTALVIAVRNRLDTIVDLILNHEQFDAKESLLNYAYTISLDETTDHFRDIKCIDVNDKSVFNDNNPLLIHAVEENNKKMVELIVNHPSFDKKKSRLNEAIFKTSSKNNIEIFKILTKIVDNDFKQYKYLGKSILVHISSFINPQNHDGFMPIDIINMHNRMNNNDNGNNNPILTEVLNNLDLVFDKKDINDSFENYFHNYIDDRNDISFQSLKQLFEYDANHDHYINLNKFQRNGSLYLTNHRVLDNHQMIQFLLENGADPNIPDKSGRYPLELAIAADNSLGARILINSGKVDLNKKVPMNRNAQIRSSNPIDFQEFEETKDQSNSEYTTYLHLAAHSEAGILRELLSKDVIDINTTDDFGNTPLMCACESHNDDNICLLFQKENLDYLHRNKIGEDALKIYRRRSLHNDNEDEFDEKDVKPISKDEYLNKLINSNNHNTGFGIGNSNFNFNFNFSTNNLNVNTNFNTAFGLFNTFNHHPITNTENDAASSNNKGSSDSLNKPEESKPNESENKSSNTTGFELTTTNTNNSPNTPSLNTSSNGQQSPSSDNTSLPNQPESSKESESTNKSSNEAGFVLNTTNAANSSGPFGNSSLSFGTFSMFGTLPASHNFLFGSGDKNEEATPHFTLAAPNQQDSGPSHPLNLGAPAFSSEKKLFINKTADFSVCSDQKEERKPPKKLGIYKAKDIFILNEVSEKQRPKGNRNSEWMPARRDDSVHRSRRSRKTRRHSYDDGSDEDQSMSFESEIAQEQLKQIVEIDYSRHLKFNQLMSDQAILMQSLNRKQRKSKKKYEQDFI